MPLVLVVMTHLRCIFLRVRGLHFQFIDRVVDIPVYDYELADPVSSRKYSGAIVFTAPFAELTVMLFTVPLNDCTIVATATVVTSCSSTADCPDSAAPMCCEGVCVAMSCGGGGFSPDDAYDSVWDSVMPTRGNSLSITSSTKTLLGASRCRVVVVLLLVVLTFLFGTV